MAARFRDPLLKAICLERLSSALTSADHLYAQTMLIPDNNLLHLIGLVRLLVHLRLFVLLRDFLDPRPLARHPALMVDVQPPRSTWVEAVRGWRRDFPTVEWQ